MINFKEVVLESKIGGGAYGDVFKGNTVSVTIIGYN